MSTALWTGPLADMTLTVQVAWSADLTADSTTWSWTDITTDVRQTPGITASLGRGDEAGSSQPARCTLRLDNTGAAYSLGGHSPNWPGVRRGTPVRVLVDPDDGAGARTLFQGFADGWTPSWDALGAIPVVTLEASGTLRRLAQGSAPLASAYRRSIPALGSVVAYWPMEENRGASGSPAAYGGDDMSGTGLDTIIWASYDGFESSAALPDLGTARLEFVVDAYTSSGGNSVKFFLALPDGGVPNDTILAHIYTQGTIGRWDLVLQASGAMALYRYNADGTLNSNTGNIAFGLNGRRVRVEVNTENDGTDLDWGMFVLDAAPGSVATGVSGTLTARQVSRVTRVVLSPFGQLDGVAVGHLTVHNTAQGQDASDSEFWAWQRAAASTAWPEFAYASPSTYSRLSRLCAENAVELTVYSVAGVNDSLDRREGLGPQFPVPLLQLLRECETVDQGQLWDGRSAGLAYTTRRFREDGVVMLTVDAAALELAAPFDPVDDDQRTRNRAEAKRTYGASAVYEDTDGPMGTATIGVYDTSVEVNGSDDTMMTQHAAWQVALGTVYGYRVPTLTVDLRATPALAGQALDLVPGDRVQVLNPDAVLVGFPADTVDLIVEGVAHRLGAAGWVATLRCSPMSPWLVGLVSDETGDTDEALARVDTDGSTLASAALAGATSLSVASSGALWSTTADDYPLILDVGGIAVRATACTGASSPQTMTVDPLPYARSSGTAVALRDPRPLAL